MGRHLTQPRQTYLTAPGIALRTKLLSHTALATSILLGSLVLAGAASAGDVTGGAGSNGAAASSPSFPPELIGTEGAGITVNKVSGPAAGGNAGPGGPGTGTPAVAPVKSSNGTGGVGGVGGAGTSGDIGALDIILNEDVDNALGVTLTTGAATGGTGGIGGNGTGGQAGPGDPGANGNPGGPGDAGGNSVGTGGVGGVGGNGAGGDIDPVTIDVTGNIISTTTLVLTTGNGTSGNGGAGGVGKGGTGGAGGVGGNGGIFRQPGGQGGDGGPANGLGGKGGDSTLGTGGSVGDVEVSASGDIRNAVSVTVTTGIGQGGTGGTGGAGQGGSGGAAGNGGNGGYVGPGGSGGVAGEASGQAGSGGLGGAGAGGDIGTITVSAGGDIVGATSIVATAGEGLGGVGGAGGAGTGGTGVAGSAGGPGGSDDDSFNSGNWRGGGGGAGGVGGSAEGSGGAGGNGGAATGGDIADVGIFAGGALTGDVGIELAAGGATGGAGGAGGAGDGGQAASGGTGGAGGSIGNIDGYSSNSGGGAGGSGGVGGSASGFGGHGGAGGNADGGSTGTVTLDVLGTLTGAITIESRGGTASAGNGGNGGTGTGKTGMTGGAGAGGGSLGNLGAGDHGAGNAAVDNSGGAGGAGGAGSASIGKGGNGGNGGTATGGNAGKVTIDRVAATNGTITVTSTGGDAEGGDGGAGGIGTTAQAGNGGTGGTGGNVGTVNDAGDTGNFGGNGGQGGDGGSGADATGGLGGAGGSATAGNAEVSISNSGIFSSTGSAIIVNAFGGNAVGGAGATGGDAIAGAGGNGGAGGTAGTGGNGSGTAGAGGDGGDGGDAMGGWGGDGGHAAAGSATVDVGNSGDINSTGTAITIIASGGMATAGAGGAGGDATAGSGGTGGTAGADGGATGGDGGNGGTAQGGNAVVTVTNDGRIFSTTGNGIDIATTSGLAAFGSGADGGAASAVAASTAGLAGQDGEEGSSNGASSITVTNTNLIDVRGIGVKATANGDNGTIQVNNTGGTITGDLGGIVVATQIDPDFIANSDIDIVNSGVITADNLMAINAKGASTEIRNAGVVIGFIDLTAEADTFDNEAGSIFSARGASTFGAGSDIYNNLAGSMLDTADAPGLVEHAQFNGIEQLRNNGLISMRDGGAEDRFTMSADAGDVSYSSSGGVLDVDAVLGDAASGKSDLMTINGNVVASPNGPTTATRVAVNVVGIAGANADGIAVIDVTGTTNAGDFVLENGPLNVGLFAWDLRLDDGGHIFELYTSGVGTSAYEFAAGLTATQDIWYQTTGTLLQRTADLRPLFNGTQVTPVADYAEPVPATPAGQVGPGFWLKGVGAWLERDQGDGIAVTDRKQSIYGGLAGFDFAAEGTGDAWLFGLFGGYLASDLKFNETDTKWTYDGPTVGAYATYLNQALYVDLLVKADFLSINIDPDAIGAEDEDTDGINLGGLIDAGYKIGGGQGVFVEPQAALAVVYTDIDDVDMLGGSIDFDEETSVRGRLGLRLGYDHTAANQVVYSSDVTASVWQELTGGDNDVSIATADFPAFGVSDEPGETMGDISLGFSVAAPEGWSGFLRGSYQFSDDLDAIAGNAGLRYSW